VERQESLARQAPVEHPMGLVPEADEEPWRLGDDGEER